VAGTAMFLFLLDGCTRVVFERGGKDK